MQLKGIRKLSPIAFECSQGLKLHGTQACDTHSSLAIVYSEQLENYRLRFFCIRSKFPSCTKAKQHQNDTASKQYFRTDASEWTVWIAKHFVWDHCVSAVVCYRLRELDANQFVGVVVRFLKQNGLPFAESI